MTVALKTDTLAAQIAQAVPDSKATAEGAAVIVAPASVLKVAEFLKNSPDLAMDYLVNLTSVDYTEYFEVVYHIFSIQRNHQMLLKTRAMGRDNPTVPSVVSVWRGADFQEREVFDLMGVVFSGHPNLKRLFLWEGFPGHPQRRDYL